MILTDNIKNQEMLKRISGHRLPADFPKHVIEDLKVRAVLCLSKKQKEDYTDSEQKIEKMKMKKYEVGNSKAYKEDFPYLQVSFFTRTQAMEVCWGDPYQEEANLAYSVCLSIKGVSHYFPCCHCVYFVSS